MTDSSSGSRSGLGIERGGAKRVAGDADTPQEEPSIGELFSRLTSETSDLLKGEVRLARAEITQEVKRGAQGAGLLGGAGVTAFIGLLLLTFAAAWGLAQVMAVGFAFLIVAGVVLVSAGLLAIIGKKKLAEVKPVPEKTISTLKEDAQWLKN
jgi:uncharacterized membrane protein YqjE